MPSGVLPVHVGGNGGGSGGHYGDIKTIRYTIAIHPTEHKVLFELTDIPLPKP